MSKRQMTRSKKNPLTAGIALLTTLLLASCTEDEPLGPNVPPGHSLYVASAIITPAPRTETEVNTRVVGDDVPVTVAAGSLGIFRSKGTGYTEALNNKKYTYTGADNGWQPATAGDTLFLNGDDADVCAYYPHNADAAYTDATTIPLYSGKYMGTGSLHDPNDLCYAIYRTVNAARRATTFEMKHALSLLEFRISKEAGYVGDCRITSIAVMNPEMLTQSAIDITTGTYGTTPTKGTITYNPGTDADGILIESSAVTTGALLIPFVPTADGLTIAFTVNGTPVEAAIPTSDIAKVEAGHRYSVKVTMKANSMQVTGVDMIPWDEVGVGGDDYTWYPAQEKVIDIGLDFWIAPGNLRKMPNGSYAFAEEQGYYSGVDGPYDATLGGDYFCWNTLDPAATTSTNTTTVWDNTNDPCRKVKGGEWHTPTQAQLQKLADLYTAGKAIWGTYEMSSGTKEGMYFGTSDISIAKANQDKYVFLSAAGNRTLTDWYYVGSFGDYWTSTPMPTSVKHAHRLTFESGDCSVNNYFDRNDGRPVRCVKDKPKDPIDIGLDFWIAPGNLRKMANGSYAFASEQGYYSGVQGADYDPAGGDYFCWNTLDPAATSSSNTTDVWDNTNDPCRKVKGGEWHTPTQAQLQKLADLYTAGKAIWGTYEMSSGTKDGMYFGTSDISIAKANQDKYVFLPAAGYNTGIKWYTMGFYGYYWSSMPSSATAYTLNVAKASCSVDANGTRSDGNSVRCVKDKPKDPIDIGLDFLIAPGNLRAIKQLDNTYKYDFAEEQGYYSGIDQAAYDPAGGDYFCWNTLDPVETTSTNTTTVWDNTNDPCRKVKSGEWYTPTQAQLQALIDAGHVWDDNAYTTKDGTKAGKYFGTSDISIAKVDQDKYVFLPAAGRHDNGGNWYTVGSLGAYWSSTPNGSNAYGLGFNNGNNLVSNLSRDYGHSVRCVRDK